LPQAPRAKPTAAPCDAAQGLAPRDVLNEMDDSAHLMDAVRALRKCDVEVVHVPPDGIDEANWSVDGRRIDGILYASDPLVPHSVRGGGAARA
jgi:hypothetical protein